MILLPWSVTKKSKDVEYGIVCMCDEQENVAATLHLVTTHNTINMMNHPPPLNMPCHIYLWEKK